MSEQNNLEANKALMRRWFEEVWNQAARMRFRNCLAKMELRTACQTMSTPQ
jgi:hypothetical protein